MRIRLLISIIGKLIILIGITQILGPSVVPLGDEDANIRAFTRSIEFDYAAWTLNAVKVKFDQFSIGATDYFDVDTQREIIKDYLELIRIIQESEYILNNIYTDPNIIDAKTSAEALSTELDQFTNSRNKLGPIAESVIQNLLGSAIIDLGFDLESQPLPPILFHSTPLPWALIVSPRDVIQQDANVSLEIDLTVEDHIQLEEQITNSLDMSTLVVPVGGIGTYPTMVAETTNLVWLNEVVAHEWIHNYLNIRPLGINYTTTPELRTMNETAANIAGKEIGRQVIATYFPEFLPPPTDRQPTGPEISTEESADPPPPPLDPPMFDFNAEMRETRVMVDELLANGDIEEAETYMEKRRVIFWDQGYQIRKLNQAYFAFYGAYADVPGGAAGEDPVGPAVRELRERSKSLSEFIITIGWMTSFDDLLNFLETEQTK